VGLRMLGESNHDSFIEAYSTASQFLEKSVFCLGYELSQCEEEKNNFILRIEWTSTKDYLEGFKKSTEFQNFLIHVKPFFSKIQEMNHYRLSNVVSKK